MAGELNAAISIQALIPLRFAHSHIDGLLHATRETGDRPSTLGIEIDAGDLFE